jgi:hypothetical protein
MNYLHQPITGLSLKITQLFSGRVMMQSNFSTNFYGVQQQVADAQLTYKKQLLYFNFIGAFHLLSKFHFDFLQHIIIRSSIGANKI